MTDFSNDAGLQAFAGGRYAQATGGVAPMFMRHPATDVSIVSGGGGGGGGTVAKKQFAGAVFYEVYAPDAGGVLSVSKADILSHFVNYPLMAPDGTSQPATASDFIASLSIGLKAIGAGIGSAPQGATLTTTADASLTDQSGSVNIDSLGVINLGPNQIDGFYSPIDFVSINIAAGSCVTILATIATVLV